MFTFWVRCCSLNRSFSTNMLTIGVSRTAPYGITLVRLSICLSACLSSVHPLLDFLKIGSLVFSGILYVNTWPWYLVTDEARFLKKKIGGPNLGSMGLTQVQNEVFCHLLEFGSYVFLEITCNDEWRMTNLQSSFVVISLKLHAMMNLQSFEDFGNQVSIYIWSFTKSQNSKKKYFHWVTLICSFPYLFSLVCTERI